MPIYYGYAQPLSLKIGRGFYQDGIWAEGGFVPYSEIGGLTWREGEQVDAGDDVPMAQLREEPAACGPTTAAARRPARDKESAELHEHPQIREQDARGLTIERDRVDAARHDRESDSHVNGQGLESATVAAHGNDSGTASSTPSRGSKHRRQRAS